MNFKTVGEVLDSRKITILIYGESGIGKTSLIKTLDCEPREVLYVAADPGQLALAPSKYMSRDMRGTKFFQPKEANDFKKIREYIVSSAPGTFKYVWIDGIDEVGERALELFKDREHGKSKPNLQAAYGDMADAMKSWIRDIQMANVATIFVTHIDENDASDIRYSPSFPGKAVTQSLKKMFDEVWCMRMARREPTSPLERLIQCTRNVGPQYEAKDRSGRLDDFEQPDLKAILTKIFGDKPQLGQIGAGGAAR